MTRWWLSRPRAQLAKVPAPRHAAGARSLLSCWRHPCCAGRLVRLAGMEGEGGLSRPARTSGTADRYRRVQFVSRRCVHHDRWRGARDNPASACRLPRGPTPFKSPADRPRGRFRSRSRRGASSRSMSSSRRQRRWLSQGGRVEVGSDPPGAEVRIDGVFKGTTPLVVNDVAAGQHRVTVTARRRGRQSNRQRDARRHIDRGGVGGRSGRRRREAG